jgi:hypothetical protein
MNTMYILNKDHAIRKSRGTHGLDEIWAKPLLNVCFSAWLTSNLILQCLWWKSQRLSKLITWTTRGHWNEFLKDSFCTHGSRRNVIQNCGKVNYA